jgi:hypothetical protein
MDVDGWCMTKPLSLGMGPKKVFPVHTPSILHGALVGQHLHSGHLSGHFFFVIAELKQFFNLGAGGCWSTLALFCVLL